jgi:hypothetical protein
VSNCAAWVVVTAWVVPSSSSVPTANLVAVDKPLLEETVAAAAPLHPDSRMAAMVIKINKTVNIIFIRVPF